MKTWVLVLALVACNKRHEDRAEDRAASAGSAASGVGSAASGVGSAAAVPADAQVVDMAVIDAGTPTGGAQDAGAQAGPPAPVDAEKLLDVERVGPLRWGMPEADVVKALGKPAQKTQPVEEGATGEFASDWSWASGVTANMVADTRTGPARLRVIHVSAPTGPQARGPVTYATARGIRLGSTRAQVAAAYPKSDEGGDDPTQFLVGSPYGGLLFVLKNDVVTEIVLGPMAF